MAEVHKQHNMFLTAMMLLKIIMMFFVSIIIIIIIMPNVNLQVFQVKAFHLLSSSSVVVSNLKNKNIWNMQQGNENWRAFQKKKENINNYKFTWQIQINSGNTSSRQLQQIVLVSFKGRVQAAVLHHSTKEDSQQQQWQQHIFK